MRLIRFRVSLCVSPETYPKKPLEHILSIYIFVSYSIPFTFPYSFPGHAILPFTFPFSFKTTPFLLYCSFLCQATPLSPYGFSFLFSTPRYSPFHFNVHVLLYFSLSIILFIKSLKSERYGEIANGESERQREAEQEGKRMVNVKVKGRSARSGKEKGK